MWCGNPVTIERAKTSEDVFAIAALYPTKTQDQRAEMIRNNLAPELLAHEQGKRTILLAKAGAAVVGTVQVVWDNVDEEPALQAPQAAVIYHLRTHPDHQGKGIGKHLVDAAERLAMTRGRTRVTLGVEPDNARARRLYQKWGYREFHRYRGQHDELLLGMQKKLEAS
jgi:ribosomal protein S18 acetylase RimI-like enzyme